MLQGSHRCIYFREVAGFPPPARSASDLLKWWRLAIHDSCGCSGIIVRGRTIEPSLLLVGTGTQTPGHAQGTHAWQRAPRPGQRVDEAGCPLVQLPHLPDGSCRQFFTSSRVRGWSRCL